MRKGKRVVGYSVRTRIVLGSIRRLLLAHITRLLPATLPSMEVSSLNTCSYCTTGDEVANVGPIVVHVNWNQ